MEYITANPKQEHMDIFQEEFRDWHGRDFHVETDK
jgi:hypothetical protein